eukprot:gene54516-11090_t
MAAAGGGDVAEAEAVFADSGPANVTSATAYTQMTDDRQAPRPVALQHSCSGHGAAQRCEVQGGTSQGGTQHVGATGESLVAVAQL